MHGRLEEISTPKQAAAWLWSHGLGEAVRKESEDPYCEQVDLNLSGRDGVDREFIKDALARPWMDLMDERIDSNWEYASDNSERIFIELFDREIGRRGSLSEDWSAITGRLEQDGDFDGDEFEDQTKEAAREIALDEGSDSLYQIQYRLRGSRQGSAELEFSAEMMILDASASIPKWNLPICAADWAALLCQFKIHPADFANAMRQRALDSMQESGFASDSPEISEAMEELLTQGLAEPAGRDPGSWSGGLLEVAKAWACHGASLPGEADKPCLDVDELIEALGQANDTARFEIDFGIGSDELEEQSELIERFGPDSPTCCEALAAKTLSLHSPEIHLNGDSLTCSGSIELDASELDWSDDRAESEDASACMASRRRAARDASELAWRLKDASGGQARAKSFTRCAELARDLGRHEPEAFQWALSHALQADQTALGAATASHDKARSGIASKPSQGAARIEDFAFAISAGRASALVGAPWRSPSLSGLAWSRDSLGNTLAHKACAGLDPVLLSVALEANPALADEGNLGGATPLAMALRAGDPKVRLALAKAIATHRPDLAGAPAKDRKSPSMSAMVASLASFGQATPEALGEFLGLGCSMELLNDEGEAPWASWRNLKAEALTPLTMAAAKAGWDINAPDRQGHRLIHMVCHLESALALLAQGADSALRSNDGDQGGTGLRADQERAALEAAALALAHPKSALAKSRSL